MTITRGDFILGATASVLAAAGCTSLSTTGSGAHYTVSVLGDLHFDGTRPERYHPQGTGSRYTQSEIADFERNADMWTLRNPELLTASAAVANESTNFVLQVGDLVHGCCDAPATHERMLVNAYETLRDAYQGRFPVMSVKGNHDVTGPGAETVYAPFAERCLSKALMADVRYPVFSFVREGDLWVFCDFEITDLRQLMDALSSHPEARHVFLVTHGPLSMPDNRLWYWRLAGKKIHDSLREPLRDLLCKRRAIVISGHSHCVEWWQYEFSSGGYSEITVNSVWSAARLATAIPISDSPNDYGTQTAPNHPDFARDLPKWKRGLKDYYLSRGAGHFRLNVSPEEVSMDFFPGATTEPAKRFLLKRADGDITSERSDSVPQRSFQTRRRM